jgi:hypothetical protein
MKFGVTWNFHIYMQFVWIFLCRSTIEKVAKMRNFEVMYENVIYTHRNCALLLKLSNINPLRTKRVCFM